MSQLIIEHFKNLFFALTLRELANFLKILASCISDELNQSLSMEYTQRSSKGLIANASHESSRTWWYVPNLWHIMGSTISVAVINALNFRNFPHALNHTHIVLIPKRTNLVKVGDFHSIGLWNVLYKLISKFIDNRLKQWIHLFISHTQSAFVPGRLITSNVLVAHELMHYIKQKMQGKNDFMSLKLDMSKTYDRVGWEFLEEVMLKMRLNQKMVALIMTCVKTVSFLIFINGEPY